ncbi:hypothetical protein C8F04DRAFT_1263341 [Mycena alexandri]|uniref:DUF6534 domain-containing protein n=1 Tax=Mycena alexandri TaxID=1745969 RepID=A0AAD6SND5_9AGAR|nr:hypothetical protein C8F04DRAFT_1263341 [Mycena alexandri]
MFPPDLRFLPSHFTSPSALSLFVLTLFIQILTWLAPESSSFLALCSCTTILVEGSGSEPTFAGVLLSTAIYGVMAVQMLLYYQTYKTDARWIRYFARRKTVNLAVEIGVIYEPLILRYGTQNALITSPLFLPGVAISLVAVSTPIQLFTAWRISVITESIVIPLLISVLAVVSFAGAVLVTIFVSIRNEFEKFQSFSWAGHHLANFQVQYPAIVDVLIAAKLTHSLTIRRTGFSAMDGQINRLVRLTVQTGAITALVALGDVILFLAFPHTTLQFIVDFPLSKLYAICLLSTLNARSRGKTENLEQRMPNALFKETTTTTQSQVQSHLHKEPTVHVVQNLYPPPPNMYTAQSSIDILVGRQKSVPGVD